MRREQGGKEKIKRGKRGTSDVLTRGNVMKSIETYIMQENWKQAQRLILKELQATPNSHWLWATLSLTYHEQHQYEKSLQCAEKALSLAPHCPLVLWHYAGALYMHGLAKEALVVWKNLLRKGVKTVANNECGEGIVSARRLLNDCNYRIARCYAWIGNKALAVRYFHKYLENRKKGAQSSYDLREVKKELATIESK
jgi:tetratricopeptide (TPR) repeat protein